MRPGGLCCGPAREVAEVVLATDLGALVRLQLEMGQDPAEVRRRHCLSADQVAVIRAGEAIGAGAAGQADVQAPPEALCASTG